MKIVVRRLLK